MMRKHARALNINKKKKPFEMPKIQFIFDLK